jgi:hypothetical protein
MRASVVVCGVLLIWVLPLGAGARAVQVPPETPVTVEAERRDWPDAERSIDVAELPRAVRYSPRMSRWRSRLRRTSKP